VKNPISIKEQLILGLLYTLNILTTNYALLYISYPLQVVGRSCRFLFVVLIGVFWSRVKHDKSLKLGSHKIYVALTITAGVLMFNLLKSVFINLFRVKKIVEIAMILINNGKVIYY
jgi:hypothetical protein